MHLSRIAAVVAAIVLSAHGQASAQQVSTSEARKWGAHVDVEGLYGNERSLGVIDFFLPLAQSDRTLLFGDIRMRADDEGSREGNFGLGLRHMFPSGWNVGAYGFFDRSRSSLDGYFSQATFGVEALGRDFDLRANGYLPFGDRVRDLAAIPGGGSYASIVGNAIEVTTMGATFSQERALQGFDAEIGWRVPIWAVEDNKALRLYAGMFRFDDSVVEAITGPRFRAELTVYELPYLGEDSRLTLGAEYQDDNVRGSQGFAMARLRIPLQSESADRRPLNWQERRMTDFVVRDIDIVTETRSVTAPTIAETATQTTNGDDITVIDSATTSGATLPSAVANAGADSFVILSGTFVTTATTTLQSGQTVMGAGNVAVQTASGRTATLTTPGATVNLSSTTTGTPAFQMASDSALSGLTINVVGTIGAAGVNASNVSGVTIANNTISVSGTNNNVAALQFVNSTVTVTGNSLSATSTLGYYAVPLFMNGGTYTIAGNTFNAAGGDISRSLYLASNLTFNPGSTGNTLVSGGCFASGTITGSIGLAGGATCPP
ncbi:inverse autotransporter beta domain-containing protein [Hyphomicrobium sp. D-2]|uniref:inverse autotransporter beta domain-containing protein n=1 Tax=Hyphomicrobium sp. D-2 TaxID=3041621 RepID=UPI0024557BF2|nr:inverse autotransporter beta domain-containing protein [Hyphomicrobium sp. D-2]MDH4983449.1 inverse autotransporter beta domain-containing protein [Hyphomicrobium sp. D-2]